MKPREDSAVNAIMAALENDKCPHTEADYTGIDCGYCIGEKFAALTAERDALAALLKDVRREVWSGASLARIDTALARIDAAGGR